LRNEFLERRIAGRHSLCPHNGGSYFGRSERSWRGPQGVLRKPGQLIVGKISGAPISPLWRDGIGICARRKQLDRRVQICEVRTLARDAFFEVVNVAADFSALETKGGNYAGVGHATNLGADPIHFLWRLRHNTAFFRSPVYYRQ
jgi:hypothetical protein